MRLNLTRRSEITSMYRFNGMEWLKIRFQGFKRRERGKEME